MPFEFNRYSGLLLIFFFHGIVYSFLLWRKGIHNYRKSDQWLALFLLCCTLYIAPWMLGFAGWYDGQICFECRNFMFYMPMQFTLMMGPAIYFYIRTLLQPSYKFQKKDWLHFLPAALYIVWCGVVFITDRIVLKRYYLMDGVIDPDFDNWYLVAGLVSLLVYGFASFKIYQRYKRFIVQVFSFADDVNFKWVRNFLIAFFIYFASNFIFHLIQWVGMEVNYVDSWWYYILFALLFYYIAINGYSNAIESRKGFQFDLISNRQHLLASAQADEVLTEDVVHEELNSVSKEIPELESWKKKITDAMALDKLYRNAELTLPDLALHFSINQVLLSKIINQGFNMNFNDFVNRFRIEEVKTGLINKANNQYTIMSLAYDAGFNSKATFNRAFKKFTGKNPKDFTADAS